MAVANFIAARGPFAVINEESIVTSSAVYCVSFMSDRKFDAG